MQGDKDLTDFCVKKNPDSTRCTFVSAAGTIQDSFKADKSRSVQGRHMVECSARVIGKCTFSCSTCMPLCGSTGAEEHSCVHIDL